MANEVCPTCQGRRYVEPVKCPHRDCGDWKTCWKRGQTVPSPDAEAAMTSLKFLAGCMGIAAIIALLLAGAIFLL